MRMTMFYVMSAAASTSCLALRSSIVRLPSAAAAPAARMYMSTQQQSSKPANGEVTKQSLERQPRIRDDMKELLLEQAHVEMSASLAYTSMSYFFEREGMSGFSTYFRKQSDEERGHCLQFLDFLSKRGGTSVIKPNMLTAAPTDFKSALHAMEIYLAHERSVADSINDKYTQAMEVKDWPTVSFLQPFVAYQVEEEDTADTMMSEVSRLSKGGLTQVMDMKLQQSEE